MIDCRREVSLPFVDDASSDAEIELASMLGQTIDTKLPGIGITTQSDRYSSHIEAHELHRALVLNALGGLGIKVHLISNPSFWKFGNSTPIHIDGGRETPAEQAGLEMRLRLHTNGPDASARVKMTMAGSALKKLAGDTELYVWNHDDELFGLPKPLSKKFGYDGVGFVNGEDALITFVEGGYDPLMTDGTLYHFDQLPFHSILFCSMTDVGRQTAHLVEPIERDTKRDVYISDFMLASQTI